MKNLLRITLLLSAAGLLRGQGSDGEAIKLLQTATQAHGGVQAISSIRDATFTGKAWRQKGDISQSYGFATNTQGLNRVRSEVSGPDFHQVYVSDGEFGWVVTNGKKQPLFTYQTANKLTEVNPVLGLLSAFAQSRLELDYAGQVSREGRTAHHVVAYLRDQSTSRKAHGQTLDSQYDIFIDTQESRIIALQFRRLGSASGQQSQNLVDEYRYADYRAVQGVIVPFQVDHLRNGHPIKRLVLESFSLASHGESFTEP